MQRTSAPATCGAPCSRHAERTPTGTQHIHASCSPGGCPQQACCHRLWASEPLSLSQGLVLIAEALSTMQSTHKLRPAGPTHRHSGHGNQQQVRLWHRARLLQSNLMFADATLVPGALQHQLMQTYWPGTPGSTAAVLLWPPRPLSHLTRECKACREGTPAVVCSDTTRYYTWTVWHRVQRPVTNPASRLACVQNVLKDQPVP